MRRSYTLVALMLAMLLGASSAWAKESLWSVSLYAGPATNDFASQIAKGDFHVEGAMVGLAIDRDIVHFSPHFKLVAEAQATHYFLNEPTTTFNLGLGLKYENLVSRNVPVAVSVYMGPSYAINPPIYVTDAGGTARYKFLNYLSVEVSVGLARAPGWDLVFREYHRSGMYGLYAKDVDEGSTLGLGIRRRF